MIDLNRTDDIFHDIDDGITKYLKIKRSSRSGDKYMQKAMRIKAATKLTQRAVSMGVALAAMDGPLPFGDVLGFAIITGVTVYAWWDVVFS